MVVILEILLVMGPMAQMVWVGYPAWWGLHCWTLWFWWGRRCWTLWFLWGQPSCAKCNGMRDHWPQSIMHQGLAGLRLHAACVSPSVWMLLVVPSRLIAPPVWLCWVMNMIWINLCQKIFMWAICLLFCKRWVAQLWALCLILENLSYLSASSFWHFSSGNINPRDGKNPRDYCLVLPEDWGHYLTKFHQDLTIKNHSSATLPSQNDPMKKATYQDSRTQNSKLKFEI